MKLSLFVVSLVAVCALMVALAASAAASTDSHFPDGVRPQTVLALVEA